VNEQQPSRRETSAAAGSACASYEAAVERLELIIERLDLGQAGLRETLELCREGRELIGFCAAELGAVGKGLQELNLDQLAAQLAISDEAS
jgi:exodeoxyribonuclease VII small subunit